MSKRLPREPKYTCAVCPVNNEEYTSRAFIAHLQRVHFHLFQHILMQFAQRVYFNELVFEKTVLEGKQAEWCKACHGEGLTFKEKK